MDPNLFIGGVAAIVGIIGLNIAVMSWMRSDMKAFEVEIRSWKNEINQEMKDFHGRLCAIDERNKK